MTSTRDGPGRRSATRAADSAECLFVVGGYRRNADILGEVVASARQRILTSPSLGDFFELRFVDMGPPASPADASVAVARLVLGLTSRPRDAARNFSALVVIDRSAADVDQVLSGCQADSVLRELKVRLYGIATTEDRSHLPSPASGWKTVIAPPSGQPVNDVVTVMMRYAEQLLSDFGSGQEPGLRVGQLDRLGATAESELRGVVEAAASADAGAILEARKGQRKKAAEAAAAKPPEPQSEADPEASRAPTDPASGAEPGPSGPGSSGPGSSAPAAPPAGQSAEPAPAAQTAGASLISRVRRRLAPLLGDDDALDVGENMLLECLARMRAGDQKNLSRYISALRGFADAGISEEEHQRYRTIIVENRALEPGLPLGSREARFYDVMLRLAYGLPLGYRAYCDIEDVLAAAGTGRPPHRVLLEAIGGERPADIRVTAITTCLAGEDRLIDWFSSGQVAVGQLISALASEWPRPHHAELMCEVTLRYLRGDGWSYDRDALIQKLRAHGYLAAVLRERYPQSEVQQSILSAILRAAYPAGLTRQDLLGILDVSPLTDGLARAMIEALPVKDGKWAISVIRDRAPRDSGASAKRHR